MISGHGNNIYNIDREIVADFSSNVYDNPFKEELLDYLKSQLNSIYNYPDPECNQLRDKLASLHHLDKDNILVCNGSTEAIYLLALAYKNRPSIIPVPSFSEYEDACKLHGHQIDFPSNNLDLNRQEIKHKTIWLCNPNNPDGKLYSRSYLMNWIKNSPDTLFIIDEAYIDLCKGGESIVGAIKNMSHVIILKSFTKLYTIPGIRLGYIVTDKEVIKMLKTHFLPWSVNTLALKAGEHIIDNMDRYKNDSSKILDSSKLLQKHINNIPGMQVVPSSTNYFLVRLTDKKSGELYDYLIRKEGLLIRNAENFHGLDSRWIRIASQGKEKDDILIKALKKF